MGIAERQSVEHRDSSTAVVVDERLVTEYEIRQSISWPHQLHFQLRQDRESLVVALLHRLHEHSSPFTKGCGHLFEPLLEFNRTRRAAEIGCQGCDGVCVSSKCPPIAFDNLIEDP